MADVFSTSNPVEVYVNGSYRSSVDANGKTQGQFASEQAKAAGIRTFNVYVDGRKITTDDAGKSMNGVSKLEIVAKDSRGRKINEDKYLFTVEL